MLKPFDASKITTLMPLPSEARILSHRVAVVIHTEVAEGVGVRLLTTDIRLLIPKVVLMPIEMTGEVRAVTDEVPLQAHVAPVGSPVLIVDSQVLALLLFRFALLIRW